MRLLIMSLLVLSFGCAETKQAIKTVAVVAVSAAESAGKAVVVEAISRQLGVQTVNNGDTLSHIAERQFGDAFLWPLIAKASGIEDPSSLKAGQTIRYPEDPTDQEIEDARSYAEKYGE